MDYNRIGDLNKYARIGKAMGEDIQGLSAYEAAGKAVDAVKKLIAAVNISIKLPDYGIRKGDLPKLVEGGMKQARLFVPNPRDLTKEDVRKIYEMTF
jgi:alcohol dehydrogenase class IV